MPCQRPLPAPTRTPRVTIALATYQGARHLQAQLDSLAAQRGADWRLIASDDGSTDGTLDILHAFADAHPGTRIIPGPRRGATQNFLHLIAHVPAGDWLALCDQDDVWMPDRLARGLGVIGANPAPAATSSRTTICDRDMRPLRPAPLYRRRASFRNALVQACLPGNTFLANPAALAIVATRRSRRGCGRMFVTRLVDLSTADGRRRAGHPRSGADRSLPPACRERHGPQRHIARTRCPAGHAAGRGLWALAARKHGRPWRGARFLTPRKCRSAGSLPQCHRRAGALGRGAPRHPGRLSPDPRPDCGTACSRRRRTPARLIGRARLHHENIPRGSGGAKPPAARQFRPDGRGSS